MRIKFISSDEDAKKKYPVILEISEFNIDDDNHTINIYDAYDGTRYQSDKPVCSTDSYEIDRIYDQLLEKGYADLTKFCNFTPDEEE